MAKKHFDKYYENYKGYYISTIEVAEEMRKAAIKGEITEDRVEAFKKDAEPVIHTFKILQEVKRMLDRPQRPDKRRQAIFEKTRKRVVPLEDENNLDKIQADGEEAVSRLKDLVE